MIRIRALLLAASRLSSGVYRPSLRANGAEAASQRLLVIK